MILFYVVLFVVIGLGVFMVHSMVLGAQQTRAFESFVNRLGRRPVSEVDWSEIPSGFDFLCLNPDGGHMFIHKDPEWHVYDDKLRPERFDENDGFYAFKIGQVRGLPMYEFEGVPVPRPVCLSRYHGVFNPPTVRWGGES